ncbi:LAMI_0H18976g1_1 [Lachancea mirantina]|uniref:DASH complex subunit SPC19 n=1 Tax=Lachancea mirantina TaxID=1230905 RepID=A0A1G4KJW3_9SACH|nr:LAMI_0H18976g1_1 [Lachancea mirantina]
MTDTLELCVASLESSTGLLDEAVRNLTERGKASSHLTKSFLHVKRVFELIPEYDFQKAKLDLIEEVEPLVNNLNNKLEKALSRLEREAGNLAQTYELNKLRLSKINVDQEDVEFDMSADPVVIVSSTSEELEELKRLKGEKERSLHKIQEMERSIIVPD